MGLVLGIDIGSSSVKAGLLRNGKIVGDTAHASFATVHSGPAVEVIPDQLMRAVVTAVHSLGKAARQAELIALSVMSPAWVAMDRAGKPLTPIITHQDRRSVAIAHELEHRVGSARHLAIAGNRPFPGGISSTTWLWFARHHPSVMKRADLVGHLNTYLHRQLTGARVIDPANASFTGLYETTRQGNWSEELCHAVGARQNQLPQITPANEIAGKMLPHAARKLGVSAGTPVVTGIVDTSSAMLLTGAVPGQLLNVSGSTDVLALCTSKASPNPKLLTRALGVGKKWMSVSTLAAAGSTLNWLRDQFFRDLSAAQYWKLLSQLARKEYPRDALLKFEPYLAGERASIDQKQAAFSGLTLATTREQMLHAAVESLAVASAARIELLRETKSKISRGVVISGGVQNGLAKLLHRDWPGRWTFRTEPEATLRGLSMLEPSNGSGRGQ